MGTLRYWKTHRVPCSPNQPCGGRVRGWGGGGCYSVWKRIPGGDLVPTMPGCVCPKVKDMGLFSASRE